MSCWLFPVGPHWIRFWWFFGGVFLWVGWEFFLLGVGIFSLCFFGAFGSFYFFKLSFFFAKLAFCSPQLAIPKPSSAFALTKLSPVCSGPRDHSEYPNFTFQSLVTLSSPDCKPSISKQLVLPIPLRKNWAGTDTAHFNSQSLLGKIGKPALSTCCFSPSWVLTLNSFI